MKKNVVLLCAFAALSGMYTSAHTKNVSENQQKWQLVWSDEFNYEGLPDSTKWSFDTVGNSYGWGNNEAEWYTSNDLKNAKVANGILRITARKEEMNGKHYTSARLMTTHKGDWKYGRIEVSAKLPAGTGTWPAIWMLPTDSKYGNWPRCGEIDIMEQVGFAPDSVFSTMHTGAYNHLIGTQRGKSFVGKGLADSFHVYRIDWDKDEIRSYIDGIHYFTFKNEHKNVEVWPYDQPFHLLLNLAIGGGLGGQRGIDDSKFPHYFDIDYVRIYKPKTK